jgi:hypothetical protein
LVLVFYLWNFVVVLVDFNTPEPLELRCGVSDFNTPELTWGEPSVASLFVLVFSPIFTDHPL